MTMRVSNLCTSHVSADLSVIRCIISETVKTCIKYALSSVTEYRLYRGRTLREYNLLTINEVMSNAY